MDRWQTYPVAFKGGLVTNLSPLQQGVDAPGTATILRNFEPSVEGGYRRIQGFDKYSDSYVPPYGSPLVQGGSQTGTSLAIANIFTEPQDGDTLTIAGVSGTYTIATSGVSYNASTKTATLTLTTSLATSPADQAVVTFSNTDDIIRGIIYYNSRAVAIRNQNIFTSTGLTWTRINTPDYGTVLVDGGSQTGTSLDVDGLTGTPQAGDTFTVAGIDKVYTISSVGTITSGAATLTISPALASSPADNAALTFLTSEWSGGNKTRFAIYNFSGTEKLVMVDGNNTPATFDGTTYLPIQDVPADIDSAQHVVAFKNHLFFGKGRILSFSAPYSDADFTPASGAGTIDVGADITALIVFREQLIVFCLTKILRVVGSTLSDFQLTPITEDIGCIAEDTVQEIGGDIMFLGPDGLRLLGATERNNDFSLGVVSKSIQSEITQIVSTSSSFASLVIRGKSQYRLLGFNDNYTNDAARGIIGTQFSPQGGVEIGWAELRGINGYVASSQYAGDEEYALFANKTGYVYQMEKENDFDGALIVATFSTPFFPITDPTLRKTLYKASLYIDSSGSFNSTMSVKYDFDQPGVIQPEPVVFSDTTSTVSFYGVASFGSGAYGGRPKFQFDTQLVGSGFVVGFQFTSQSSGPPFSFDSLVLQYGQYGRR